MGAVAIGGFIGYIPGVEHGKTQREAGIITQVEIELGTYKDGFETGELRYGILMNDQPRGEENACRVVGKIEGLEGVISIINEDTFRVTVNREPSHNGNRRRRSKGL